MDSVWTNILACLRKSLSEPGYQTLMSSVSPISFADNIMVLEVQNAFSREWFKSQCEPILQQDFLDIHSTPIIFQLQINEDQADDEPEEQLSIFEPPTKKVEQESQQLNTRYVFDSFIVGHNNRFAYAASEAVAKKPAKAYNPLFIYGSVGLGKTHLINAIGNHISEHDPSKKVVLISSEKFTNDMINAIKEKNVDNFRASYRNADILIVDDIQFLAGKEQTQVEFFHTFNDLYNNNKQLIITSDQPPKEIPALELRLQTRFQWGLTADIQPPEFETRIAILQKKSELHQFDISDDILHYIASQFRSNVREMEGALTRIVAYASLLNTPVTLSIASNVVKDIVGIQQENPLTITHIQKKICNYFTLTEQDLISKSRTKELSYARQIAMYLCRELTNVSLPKIGEKFGGRDHTTVMHACDKIKTMMSSDSETQSTINSLIAQIKQ